MKWTNNIEVGTMNTKDRITDTELKELSEGKPPEKLDFEQVIIRLATELLSLRGQKVKLIEDGKRLSKFMNDMSLDYDPCYGQYYCRNCSEAISYGGKIGDCHSADCQTQILNVMHTALLKEIM